MAAIKYSVLDLATVIEGRTIVDTFQNSVENAQQAEALGYTRYWFAEHQYDQCGQFRGQFADRTHSFPYFNFAHWFGRYHVAQSFAIGHR